jgi:hypothetical protein
VSAEALTETNTSSSAKAGVIVRQSTAAGAVFYDVVIKPAGTVEVQYRAAAGTAAATATTTSAGFPQYVKITDVGNVFTAWTSTDGSYWTAISGSTKGLSMSAGLLAGLAVTSHNTSALNIATFALLALS